MIRTWIWIAAFSGLAGTIAYPVAVFAPLPTAAQVCLVIVWALGMSMGAVGTFHFFALHRNTVTLQIGIGSTMVAGVVVLCMLIVQMSVRAVAEPMLLHPPGGTTEEMVRMSLQIVDQVQLGFDIVWDIFLCLGALCLAWNMRRHPRFGWLFAAPGMVVAVALFALNIATFPVPPGEAGLVDLGPVIGLWYLFVAIRIVTSLGWVDTVLARSQTVTPDGI